MLRVSCIVAGVLAATVLSLPASASDSSRWRAEAAATQIVRDDWGIAHVHGKTDADAVFGMAYAQAEDDFNRVEMNYVTALGRMAEVKGEDAIWQDLRQRLWIDPQELKADYAKSPGWLKTLMNAWADGLNYYLATHPQTKPKLITHFEPWMALSFSEGSIGGDIERVVLTQLEDFYGNRKLGMTDDEKGLVFHEPQGSNGIAITAADTKDGHALLLINPHTSFYFRSELQMSSGEGLDAYGAVTWGQFFIYQGFNPHIGWMHTSTAADNVDEFAEPIVRQNGKIFYRYGSELRPMGEKTVTLRYRKSGGSMGEKSFTTYYTSHGPITREEGGKWIAMALMNKPIAALEQSWLRTKASDYASYMKVAELKANSSNNTIFADDKGETALLLPQFMPKRDDRFDYTKPVDGSNPATDWHGLTPLDDLPHVVTPKNGWLYNSNNWPYSAAGADSPKRADFPKYMDTVGETPRGLHAIRVLGSQQNFTTESLLAAAFDPYMPAFARLVPKLVRAWDALLGSDPLKTKLRDQIALLRGWDFKWSDHSLATSLAVFWGDTLWDETIADAKAQGINPYDYMADHANDAEKLKALAEASDRLQKDFGNWRTPWGWINRFQRVNDSIEPSFDDNAPSFPVPFVSSRWGSLASFGAKRYPNTKRYYGTSGNSFVAIVEFGPKIRAIAVTAGGESGDPGSPHFDDEAIRYARGELRPVYFYPRDLVGHTERTYHPGTP
ncbi:MAG: penicillin acylase family protein [Rhizomicrobium sp.]